MKKLIYSFSLVVLSIFGLSAQSFTLEPLSISYNPPATETETKAHLTVKNTSSSTKTYKWERTVLQISPNCKTQVCDPTLCYLPSVNSKEFMLDAGASGTLSVYFLNNTGLLGCAKVELKFYEVGDLANAVTASYTFNDCSVVLDTKDFEENNIKFYPNPVTTSFQLENAAQISLIHIIAQDGRLVKSYVNTADENSFSVADLTQGAYYLMMEDKNGKTIKVLNFEKQ
jgi:hypothetical protein